MDGYRAFQHYLALKRHFTKDKYNVFEQPRVSIPEAFFLKRNDRALWDKLAREYPDSKELMAYMVANIAYGHMAFVYNPETGLNNYKTWIKIHQSITKIFEDEVANIFNFCEKTKTNFEILMDFDGASPPPLLNLYLGKRISLETMVILDLELNYITDWKGQMSSFFSDEIRLIDKSKRFVKFNKEKAREIVASFKTDLEV